MNTVFWIKRAKNSGLFPLVMRAYHARDESPTRQHKTGVVNYRGLNWRIMSDDDIYVEIYDELVTKLPEPLLYASFELIYMYDFLTNATFRAGRYSYLSADAHVSIQSIGLYSVHEVAIMGDDLQEMSGLYWRLVAGGLSPNIG